MIFVLPKNAASSITTRYACDTSPNREIFNPLKVELWKDQRLLEMINTDDMECLKRSYETEDLAEMNPNYSSILKASFKLQKYPM